MFCNNFLPVRFRTKSEDSYDIDWHHCPPWISYIVLSKAEPGMWQSFSFQNFYFNVRERYISFYLKWCYESFSVGPEVISGYGFAQIHHPYIFSGIHGNENDISLRSLIGAIKRGSLVARKPIHLRFRSPPQISLGPVIIRLNGPTQEKSNCSVRVSHTYFYLRFCKRNNNLLEFSQDSISLELPISSQSVHFLGQLSQQLHSCKLVSPI